MNMNTFLQVFLSSVLGAAASGAAQAIQSGHIDLTTGTGWSKVGLGAGAAAATTAIAHLLPSPLAQSPNSPLVSSAAAAADKQAQQ